MPVLMLGKCLAPLSKCVFHSHDTWEIILNTDGYGIDFVGDSEYPFMPGSILCIPPHMPHAKTSTNHFKDIFIQSDDFLVSKGTGVLQFQDSEDKSIETLMTIAYQTFHRRDGGYLNATGALYDAIQYLLIGKKKKASLSPVIERLTGSIIDNFLDPEFEVSKAISALPYFKDYIRRLFKQETGTTPVAYMNELCLEHAKKLLKQRYATGYTANEIALLSGFYDPRYFSRLFHRHTGMSPLQFAASPNQRN